jgi:hypothetical protein
MSVSLEFFGDLVFQFTRLARITLCDKVELNTQLFQLFAAC